MISFSSVHMQQGQELVNRWALGSNRKLKSWNFSAAFLQPTNERDGRWRWRRRLCHAACHAAGCYCYRESAKCICGMLLHPSWPWSSRMDVGSVGVWLAPVMLHQEVEVFALVQILVLVSYMMLCSDHKCLYLKL